MLLILDHVLTTISNNRPHLTTFFGDCFDGFNKSGNQLGFKPLIASNKHTIIPACHQHLSSRPRHKKLCSLLIFKHFTKSLIFLFTKYGRIWSRFYTRLSPVSYKIEHRCILFSIVVQTILIYRPQSLLCCRVILLDIGI